MAGDGNPYRELFERSADAILIIEGDQFVDCNDATVRMLRYQTREEVLRTHPSELSPPIQPDGRPSYEKANEMIATAFERGSHQFEWMHRRADGEVFPVDVLLTAVEETGRRVLHVVWRDITARKRLEDELRHAQKMEAVGKLAGGIAHDFNNLLVVILGHADLISDLANADPRIAENSHAIQEAGERAAELVRRLLAFGRKQQRLPEVLDLNDLVGRLQTMLARLVGEDLELEMKLATEPLPVEADAGQIEQVIMNLVSNARDASPEGGLLHLATEAVTIPAVTGDSLAQIPAGRCGRITVSDSGLGMPPEVLRHAFDPFFTTKDPGRGTGLGLSTSHSIVQENHGQITIESAPGAGTTVRVDLPLTTKPMRASSPRLRPGAGSMPAGGGERILVVEDDPSVRAMILRVLGKQGYELFAAADGLEGVERYLRHAGAFDLVVTDVIMPRATGPRMIELLAEQGHHPRVLFVSGYTDDALPMMRGIGAGVDLLAKPFTPGQLAARVRRAIEDGPVPEQGR